jgi:protein ImuB
MAKRFVSIWFRYLATDWFSLRQPQLRNVPFVISAPSHGRMIVTAANPLAEAQGVYRGMVLADARAIIPAVQVVDHKPGLTEKLLTRIAEWCIRFTPVAAVDLPGGIVLDATGCAHLWGGEAAYLADLVNRMKAKGYHVRAAIADTIGAAWAVARFGQQSNIIQKGETVEALLPLPPAALRIEPETVDRLHKLGLRQVKDFISMPRSALRRRFGQSIVQRLNQAAGLEDEIIEPVVPVIPYHERLPSLEPIVTAKGIEIALRQLLGSLCKRLQQEQKGVRSACFKGYRVDGKMEQVDIATSRASCNVNHLFKLFEIKLQTIEPALGIELFVLEAPRIEDHTAAQEKIWETTGGLEDVRLSELIDRLTGKIGCNSIHRFLPAEHYWPERSMKPAVSLQEKATTQWKTERPRPIQLLPAPEHIDVTAPVPDYPPMLFRYKGKIHKIKKSDGPERIEQEWWMQDGQHRDYYVVEDEHGCRYWLFRLGHYDEDYEWFIHGFFM